MDVLSADHERDHDPALDSTPFFRPKPDGDLNPAGEAGWYLQREREKRGLSLDQISEATGIHPYHVEAIETGDLTRLPRRLEALEMVGIYGEYMGFEPEPLVTHYAAFLPRPQAARGRTHPADPGPLSSAKILKFGKMPPFPRFSLKSFPGGAGGVIGSCFAAVLLFAAASWLMQPVPLAPAGGDMAQSDGAEPEGDPMATASTGQSDTDVAVREEPMPETEAEAKVEDETPQSGLEPTDEEGALSGIGAFIEDGFQKPETEALPQKAAPAPQGSEPAAGQGADATPAAEPGSRLVLKAKAPVWVRIEDAQGNVVMTQMLRGGDTYSVPDRQGLVVIARDGGLLSYIIDGKERGILGTPGQILVGQPLDIPTLEKRG
ncbi:MAG: RodZ domain-containing protein [Parvibaculaceae bacterium]